MNLGIIRRLTGKVMYIVGAMMILPLLICIIYQEKFINYLAFLIPIVLLIGIGLILNIKKASNKMQAREGFVIVGISWLILSLFGSLPLIISGFYPNFFDAFFEITSGFTTTGASITTESVLNDLLINGHSILFWRSFSHWIGGMGVLVFILAIIPESNEGSAVHILRAESPGPTVGRLVSKMRASSRILYLIYIVLTLIEVILLWVGPNKEMDLFDSVIYSFGTAGTGGFAINSISIEAYSAYYQYVIGSFMLIFGINFTMYYLILIGKGKEVFKNEELRFYLITILVSVTIIMFNMYSTFNNFEETFRLSFFQVSSIMSTTGYSTANFASWKPLSQVILVILMFMGSCAGSTAGGVKISRIVILLKSAIKKIKGMVNPRKVETIKIDGKPITDDTVNGVYSFFLVYILLFILCAIIISIDGFDVTTNFTASLACISNIGPGLSMVGPYGSYANFSNLSKLVLSLEMIAGRLELFPLLILFAPTTWLRK